MAEKKSIYEHIFGNTPEAQALADARQNENVQFQQMLNARKNALEKQRTDDKRMATFSALSNALTALAQPMGWAKSGATAPVQPLDNRQYLESFGRAIKASDDLRNLAGAEEEYGLRMAQKDSALGEYAARKAADAKIQNDYARQRHQYTMDEIEARGDNQKEVAEIRGKYRSITKNGRPQTEQDLKTAHTAWVNYLKQFWTDSGRNVERAEGNTPLTFEQFLGREGYIMNNNTATPAATDEPTTPKATPTQKAGGKTGGFKVPAKEKKGGFITK